MKKTLVALFTIGLMMLNINTKVLAAEDSFIKSCGPNQIILSTGVSNNTYSQAMKPLIGLVPDLICERTDSSGGAKNVEFLLGLGGDAEAAIVPTDVLEYMVRTNPDVKKLRSIAALWGNALHIIVSVKGYGVKKWGGVTSDTKYIQDFRDLRGMKIAVFGSPVISARVIDERLKMNFSEIIKVSSVDEGKAKVEKGEVQAFMVMGGYPIRYITDLDPAKFTLANVDAATITALGAPYYATKINYPEIGVNGFYAITARNEIIVRDYQSQKWIQRFVALHDAIKDNLIDLQEMRGAHAAWKLVNAADVDVLFWTPYAPLVQALQQTGATATPKMAIPQKPVAAPEADNEQPPSVKNRKKK
jgi:TRAP-type uncharacterized transport system substrate-binding protein